jgi:hypothetical protein
LVSLYNNEGVDESSWSRLEAVARNDRSKTGHYMRRKSQNSVAEQRCVVEFG